MKKHVQTVLASGLILFGTADLGRATSLIITGVIDGPLTGGMPKAVELYAVSDISSLELYGLGVANNGGGTDGVEFRFATGSAAAGEFLYVAADNPGFSSFFGFSPDAVSSALTINGDDALELFEDDMVIDVFGNIASDGTGQPWEYLDGWAYRHDGAMPLDSPLFLLQDWYFSGPNALDGETVNLKAAYPFPAGSFSPGTVPPTVPTPEPATLLLLGSGIAALAGSRIRSGRKKGIY